MTEQRPNSAKLADMAASERCAEVCTFGPTTSVKDPDFGVKFGEMRTCSLCGWRLFDDWAALRAGSIERWLPPEIHGTPVDGDAARPK